VESMVHLCLGWELSSIEHALVFNSECKYNRPNPTEYEKILNCWWDDLFDHLKEFSELDVFACSGNMDFFQDDEVYILGIRVDFGYILSHNNYDSDDYSTGTALKSLEELIRFSHKQKQAGSQLPAPKVHISEWYEHAFIDVRSMVAMTLQYHRERERKTEEWNEKSRLGLCNVPTCLEKANLAFNCRFCTGKYCNLHQTQTHCGCGISRN